MQALTKLPTLLPLLSFALLVGGCDAAIQARQAQEAEAQANVVVEAKTEGLAEVKTPVKVEAKADVEVVAKVKVEATLKAETLDLESITYLVKKGKVKDAKALEAKINAPKEKLNDVDLDGDGKIDKIVIFEVKKDDGTIIFELHAVPSKTKKKEEAVVVAIISFVPDKETNVLIVKATYTPVVIGYDTIVYDYTVPIVVKNDVVVVEGGVGFYGWLYATKRPAYYGVFIYEAPPPPVFVIEVSYGYQEGGCWPPGHCKHGKWKSNGGYGGR
jgi:hypothetical protein